MTTNIPPGFLPRYHCLGKIPGDPAGKGNPARIPAEIPLRDYFLSGSRRDFCREIYFLPGSRREAGILPGSRRERKISPGFLPGCHCLGNIPGDPAGKGKSRQDSRRDSPPRLFLVRIPAGFLPGNLFPAGIPSGSGNLAGIPPGKENLAGILAGMRLSRQDPGRSRQERKIPPGFPPRFPSGYHFLSGSRRDFCREIHFPPGSRREAGILPGSRRDPGSHFTRAGSLHNRHVPDLPTSKTCKSGDLAKKPRKTWRLGPQTWRFPKYV